MSSTAGDQPPGPAAGIWPGQHHPLGAAWTQGLTNFAVHAPEATGVEVCLFDDDGTETRHQLTERTLGVWHGSIPGVECGQRYGYRASGPWDPAAGRRFNPAKLLLDPYSRAISGSVVPSPALRDDNDQDSAPATARSVVVDEQFDWDEDARPSIRWADTVIYELHVKGFTALHDRVPEHLRGTYAGLSAPAPLAYLKDLGVTTVELLPVHQFVSEPALAERGLVNYWGYNSIGFFAPHNGYSSTGDLGGQVAEFKQMVKALHEAGLEVVLDVVYNHTAEGGPDGPTLSFRGLDEAGFYKHLGSGLDPMGYWDVTGCGNTVDASNPAVLRLILDSLRYWVTEMHVDGFRFDLAPALARTGHRVDMAGHFITAIGQDPVLRHVKLIAEPWDASQDGYQVGSFPPPWCEWNDRYRDTIRDFWRAESGGVRDVASRLAGSSDLYADDGRSPYASINFTTSHDGFTLRDLVSYNDKHNEANGEDGRDGSDHNHSWNCGVEGPSDDPDVNALRRRQAANLMSTLVLSAGVPMITAGDERGRTQRGNNNAYCQDNEISWLDWAADDAWLGLYEVTKAALRLRREHPVLRQRHFLEGRPAVAGAPKDLAWLHPEGRELHHAEWFDERLHVLGMFVFGDPLRAPGPHGERLRDSSFLVWFNATAEPARVAMPERAWAASLEVVLSTDEQQQAGVRLQAGESLTLAARSLVALRS